MYLVARIRALCGASCPLSLLLDSNTYPTTSLSPRLASPDLMLGLLLCGERLGRVFVISLLHNLSSRYLCVPASLHYL